MSRIGLRTRLVLQTEGKTANGRANTHLMEEAPATGTCAMSSWRRQSSVVRLCWVAFSQFVQLWQPKHGKSNMAPNLLSLDVVSCGMSISLARASLIGQGTQITDCQLELNPVQHESRSTPSIHILPRYEYS